MFRVPFNKFVLFRVLILFVCYCDNVIFYPYLTNPCKGVNKVITSNQSYTETQISLKNYEIQENSYFGKILRQAAQSVSFTYQPLFMIKYYDHINDDIDNNDTDDNYDDYNTSNDYDNGNNGNNITMIMMILGT